MRTSFVCCFNRFATARNEIQSVGRVQTILNSYAQQLARAFAQPFQQERESLRIFDCVRERNLLRQNASCFASCNARRRPSHNELQARIQCLAHDVGTSVPFGNAQDRAAEERCR